MLAGFAGESEGAVAIAPFPQTWGSAVLLALAQSAEVGCAAPCIQEGRRDAVSLVQLDTEL